MSVLVLSGFSGYRDKLRGLRITEVFFLQWQLVEVVCVFSTFRFYLTFLRFYLLLLFHISCFLCVFTLPKDSGNDIGEDSPLFFGFWFLPALLRCWQGTRNMGCPEEGENGLAQLSSRSRKSLSSKFVTCSDLKRK